MARIAADMSEFRALARSVKGADKEIRTGLFRAVSVASKPVKKEVADSARRTLPARGGLNEWVANAQVQVRQAYSGRDPGITIKASKAKTATSRVKTEHHGLIGPLAPRQARTRTVRKQKQGSFGTAANLARIDEGSVMHPVWGRAKSGGGLAGPQRVKAGFFTDVMMQRVAVRAEKEIVTALREAVQRITRSGRSAV